MPVSVRIPARLDLVPVAMPAPPVVSRAQELPFEQLEWKNFERLCVRLARAQSDIEDCREYGVQGDEQEGIDLYAVTKADPRYVVYQCKREQEFGPAKIASAVELFIRGEWSKRAKEFYLCAMESFAPKKRAEALQIQAKRLETRGIKLVPWDGQALNTLLKDLPEIVDDFFGRAWTKLFCGEEAVARLGERLDGAERAELRRRFARLYCTIFRRDDVSFPFRDPSLPATESLVLPDMLTQETVVAGTATDDLPASVASDWTGVDQGEDPALVAPLPQSAERVEHRTPLADWLPSQGSVAIVGDPGSGKSTLLRIVALDLLSDAPQLEALAHRWATSLPVWIPFAHWTALLSQAGAAAQVSLQDVVATWLRLHGEADLIPLVAMAQKERRLLLLVDGLDEWQTVQGASIAMGLLEVFAATHDAPVFATCRPRALDVLGRPADWSVGRIAPLSQPQQAHLAERILRRQMLVSDDTGETSAADRAHECLKDIRSREELAEISQTPLLLDLLVQLWHREERLPESRFRAYGQMVGLLVDTHPSRRMKAAKVDVPKVGAEDLRHALGALALAVLVGQSAGIIGREAAASVLERYFHDDEEGVGLPTFEARQMTERVLEHATDRAGILVARSPSELGFYHRAILEYLAAEAIATKATDVQLRIVRERARDPQWHEVLVALTTLTPSRPLVTSIVAEIQGTRRTALDKLLTAPLLASIAFSTAGCPPRTAREIAEEVLDEIEIGKCLPIRERLLEHAVRGLGSPATQALIRGRLKRWLPRRDTYRQRIYRTIAGWVPQTATSMACLWRGLHDEDLSDVREAASGLLRQSEDMPGSRREVLDAAANSPSPRVRAAILDAFFRARLQLSAAERERITGRSPRGELHLVAIRGRVAAGEQTPADLESMLEFATRSPDLDYRWNDDIDEILAAGWAGSDYVRRVALRSIGDRQTDSIDETVARRVLVRAFLGDDDVAEKLAAEISSGEHITDYGIWPLYAKHAQSCDRLKAALDAWIPTVQHFDVEVHWAARTTRSDTARRVLLTKLGAHSPGWAASALLEGWGMSDPEVATALRGAVDSSARTACELAPRLADILQDRQEAKRRLLQLLPEGGFRFGYVVGGLGGVRDPAPEPEVVSAILNNLERQADRLGEARGALFAHFADDQRVVDIARRDLRGNDDSRGLAAIAVAAERAPELRSEVLEVIGVLPARLRLTLAERLDAFSHDSAVTTALSAYPHEWEAAVRTQCAVVHHSLSRGTEDPELDLMRREISKTGVILDAARAAALAAALHVNRLDVFVNATDSNGAPLRLRPGWLLRGYNGPFWREVARNWQLLKSRLGADLFPRLSDSEDGSVETWEALAIVASHSRELTADIVTRVSHPGTAKFGPNTLRVVARELAQGTALRELLIRCIHDATRRTSRGTEVYADSGIVAAELLGDTFARDPETLALIVPATPKAATPPVLPTVALAIGWPQSPELHRHFVYLCDNKLPFPEIGYGAVVATKSDVDIVMRVLATYDEYVERLRPAELRIVTRLFLRRLRKDDDVYEEALATSKGLSGPNQVALLRLIAAARGTGDVRTTMEELADKELNGSVAPTLVRDPFTGGLVTSSGILLDGLLGL